jgi:metal-responsive CopG/Arc/MetJ family transcriptional regulator
MSTQELKVIDVEVEFPKGTVLAVDELATILGRSRDELISEAIKQFVALHKHASGTGHTADEPPTVK